MPHARVNGARLYYEQHGSGPDVIFLHGAGGNHLSWWQQIAVFAERYRCTVFDARGWGPSPGAAAFVGGPPPGYRGSMHDPLASLGVPILFLVGEHDKITSPSLIREAQGLVPGA